jgi:succinate dehydrogenase/fumarate reductase-like Fe-S protein
MRISLACVSCVCVCTSRNAIASREIDFLSPHSFTVVACAVDRGEVSPQFELESFVGSHRIVQCHSSITVFTTLFAVKIINNATQETG